MLLIGAKSCSHRLDRYEPWGQRRNLQKLSLACFAQWFQKQFMNCFPLYLLNWLENNTSEQDTKDDMHTDQVSLAVKYLSGSERQNLASRANLASRENRLV